MSSKISMIERQNVDEMLVARKISMFERQNVEEMFVSSKISMIERQNVDGMFVALKISMFEWQNVEEMFTEGDSGNGGGIKCSEAINCDGICFNGRGFFVALWYKWMGYEGHIVFDWVCAVRVECCCAGREQGGHREWCRGTTGHSGVYGEDG